MVILKDKYYKYNIMSTRTIASPGVQITEQDLTLTTRPIGATDVLITGFAPQGPTEDLVNISDISEFEQIYGVPTNSSERYLYHSVKQILNTSPANLQVSRLPYGSDLGVGYANQYSALIYPVSAYVESLSTIPNTFIYSSSSLVVGFSLSDILAEVTNLGYFSVYSSINTLTSNQLSNNLIKSLSAYTVLNDNGVTTYYFPLSVYTQATTVVRTSASTLTEANRYELQSPISVLIDDATYSKIIANDISWRDSYTYANNITAVNNINTISDFYKAGLIVINDAKRSINDLYEGYYLGITDNLNINPSTDFDSVSAIYTTQSKTVASGKLTKQDFYKIPTSRFNFPLTQKYTEFGGNSISEKLESLPTEFDFKSDTFDDSLVFGLFKLKTTIFNQDTITLDYNLVEGYVGSVYSKRTQNNPTFGTPNTFFIDTIVNNKSNNIKVITNPYIANSGIWTAEDGKPAKKIRISNNLKAMYPTSVYLQQNNNTSKDLGNVPLKLQRILNQIQNNENINVDVVVEGGLGTIWAGAKYKREKDANNSEYIFDENYYVDISELKNTSGEIVAGINSDYSAIANKFVTFATDRKDHLFIADPLRYIFVQGRNYKTIKDKNYVFSNDIYWGLKNQFAAYQCSYMASYGNWLKVTDDFTTQDVWVPPSGFIASIIATSSQILFPWAAPAGLNRGTLINVLDIGVDATQKQSDLLYKININPISFFGVDGFAVFGQKTLYRKPSAFDRINVRRLFLTLEKQTKELLKYYVFEPNTFTTRQRLVGALLPIFDKAKLNDGLYEYEIVCDERNNTPDVIDNNELKVSIYIKPVRTAEFILADFIGTRTGVTFSEIIG
jgi:hypothetical protein